MAIAKTTQMANRCGLDLKIHKYNATASAAPSDDALATINFANEVSIDLSGDTTWATGEKGHRKIVGFSNPMEGTLKISTQMVTMELLALIAGTDVESATTKVTFKDGVIPTPYIITGETVWVDEAGNSYAETIIAFKATPKRVYNVTYNGEGDPTSLDVEFELAANSNNDVLDIARADAQP